jgi:hypothetical protein
MANTPIARIRRDIMKRQGLRPLPKTKQLVPVHEYPDTFPKTSKMKMLEYKYHIKLDVILFDGSLSEVARFLNNEVDRSTISKWRDIYRQYMHEKELKEW